MGAEAAPGPGPLLIDAPVYNHASNGIKCLYYLALELQRGGTNVMLVPRKARKFNPSALPTELQSLPLCHPREAGSSATFLCSESVPRSTVETARSHGLRVVWWYLAPHDVLAKASTSPKPGEVILPFSPYICGPDHEYFYYQPPFDEAWQEAATTIRQEGCPGSTGRIGVYMGKGRLAALSAKTRKFLRGYRLVPITRSFPSNRRELFRVLSLMDGIITYDELSQLCLESATLGLPVFLANPLYEATVIRRFPIDLRPWITADEAEFMERVTRRLKGMLLPLAEQSTYRANSLLLTAMRELVSGRPMGGSVSIQQLASYGRNLAAAQVLFPHFNGQATGSQLLPLYLHSVKGGDLEHHALVAAARVIDQLGRVVYQHGGSLAWSLVQRIVQAHPLCASSALPTCWQEKHLP